MAQCRCDQGFLPLSDWVPTPGQQCSAQAVVVLASWGSMAAGALAGLLCAFLFWRTHTGHAGAEWGEALSLSAAASMLSCVFMGIACALRLTDLSHTVLGGSSGLTILYCLGATFFWESVMWRIRGTLHVAFDHAQMKDSKLTFEAETFFTELTTVQKWARRGHTVASWVPMGLIINYARTPHGIGQAGADIYGLYAVTALYCVCVVAVQAGVTGYLALRLLKFDALIRELHGASHDEHLTDLANELAIERRFMLARAFGNAVPLLAAGVYPYTIVTFFGYVAPLLWAVSMLVHAVHFAWLRHLALRGASVTIGRSMAVSIASSSMLDLNSAFDRHASRGSIDFQQGATPTHKGNTLSARIVANDKGEIVGLETSHPASRSQEANTHSDSTADSEEEGGGHEADEVEVIVGEDQVLEAVDAV